MFNFCPIPRHCPKLELKASLDPFIGSKRPKWSSFWSSKNPKNLSEIRMFRTSLFWRFHNFERSDFGCLLYMQLWKKLWRLTILLVEIVILFCSKINSLFILWGKQSLITCYKKVLFIFQINSRILYQGSGDRIQTSHPHQQLQCYVDSFEVKDGTID